MRRRAKWRRAASRSSKRYSQHSSRPKTGSSPAVWEPFSLPGSGGQTQFTDLTPGSFTITETPVEGWYTSVECDSGETSQNNQIVVQLDPGEDIVCTFLNVLPQ